MTQTRKKWDSLVLSRADFCMAGRCHSIPCFHFLFFLEAAVKRNTWMRMIPGHGYGSYLKSAVLKVTWFQLCSTFFLKITQHINSCIWKILYSWRFYGYGSTYMLILSWVNFMKWKCSKVPWKWSVAQKSEPVLWRTLHQNISLIILLLFASQTKLVFKFNLVLIE